ncbi:MAG TPA: hypothetical protein VGO50_02665 [Pyrinomonadaceae bacterium]|jgi:hypothetical protein|nr:hypothetical protein [Pyrinomonadaceae bacterium]
MKRTLFVIGLMLISSIVTMSQDNGSQDDRWKNIQALSKDQRLVVETRNGKTIKGKFASGDAQKMSLLKSGKLLDISKNDIKRVYVGKKKRSILGGVLGGLGGMILLGSAVNAASSDSDQGGYGGMVAGSAGLFGGALLGGKLGGKTQKAWLIYEAP